MSERVDLYDSNRLFLNKTMNRKDSPQSGEFFIVVHGLLINKFGDILIQQRVSSKTLWPNLWDVSCSGALVAGESSQEGLEREINEELGINIDLTNIPPTLTASFQYGFSDYYVIECEKTIEELSFEPKEIQELKWVRPETIFNYIDQKKFVPYNKKFMKALLDVYSHKSEIHPM